MGIITKVRDYALLDSLGAAISLQSMYSSNLYNQLKPCIFDQEDPAEILQDFGTPRSKNSDAAGTFIT